MLTLSQLRNSYPIQLRCSLATGRSPKALLALSAPYHDSHLFQQFVAQTANTSKPVHILGGERTLEASVVNLRNSAKAIAEIEDWLGLTYPQILKKIEGEYPHTPVSKIFDLQAPTQWQSMTRGELIALLEEFHFWVEYINELDIVRKAVLSAKSLYYFLRRHHIAACERLADVVLINADSWDLDGSVTKAMLSQLFSDDPDCILRWIEQPEPMIHVHARSKRRFQSLCSWVIMSMMTQTYGYASNLWATRAQWRQLGYKLRKNAKAAPSFHSFSSPAAELPADKGDEGKLASCHLIELVYNASEVDKFRGQPYEELDVESLHLLQDRLVELGVNIQEQSEAKWHPDEDFIEMPPATALSAKFTNRPYFAALLPHLIQWCGHPQRCDFASSLPKGANPASFFSLVAEVGSAYLAARFGLDKKGKQSQVQVIANWLDELDIDDQLRSLDVATNCAFHASSFLLPHGR